MRAAILLAVILSSGILCSNSMGYEVGYEQANVHAACCQSNGKFHRRCVCNAISEHDPCQSLCSNDNGCKGYVMYNRSRSGDEDACQLATTSECLSTCTGPVDTKHVSRIDPNAHCGSVGYWNGGCFIKQVRKGNNGAENPDTTTDVENQSQDSNTEKVENFTAQTTKDSDSSNNGKSVLCGFSSFIAALQIGVFIMFTF